MALVLKGNHRQRRSEDFLFRDLLLGRDAVENRRGRIKAGCERRRLLRLIDNPRAFFDPSIDVLNNLSSMRTADQGAEASGLFQRIADREIGGFLDQQVDELLLDTFLHQETGTGRTDLSLV